MLNIHEQSQCNIVDKLALHFVNTKLHSTLSLKRSLRGRMKMPPWLKMHTY